MNQSRSDEMKKSHDEVFAQELRFFFSLRDTSKSDQDPIHGPGECAAAGQSGIPTIIGPIIDDYHGQVIYFLCFVEISNAEFQALLESGQVR